MEFDRELIVRAQLGDRAAQEAVVRDFAPMVFRLVSRFFRVREDVEDIAQEIFLKVFSRFDQVRPEDNFPGWLAKVTVNTCYDELRRSRRQKLAMQTYGSDLKRENTTIQTPEPDPFGVTRGALLALDAKLRMPLVLKEVEEMSIEEIARTMGLTQTNVKVRLFRARKKLAKLLGGKNESA